MVSEELGLKTTNLIYVVHRIIRVAERDLSLGAKYAENIDEMLDAMIEKGIINNNQDPRVNKIGANLILK